MGVVMYLENRLVAMLDVLGLSRRLGTREQLEATSRQYSELIQSAKQKIFTSGTMLGSASQEISNFEVGEFVFDNLVLVSHPLTTHTACQFVMALTHLMEVFALGDMPLRGAIGLGDYCYDAESNVFLSNIFKALSAEEGRQNWAGCVVLDDAAEYLVNEICGPEAERFMSQSSALLKLEVPAKDPMGRRWCLNWMHLLSPSQRQQILSFLAGDPSKLAGTEGYLNQLSALPPSIGPVFGLPPEFSPAVAMKTLNSRATARVQFVDASGESVKPGVENFTLAFIGGAPLEESLP